MDFFGKDAYREAAAYARALADSSRLDVAVRRTKVYGTETFVVTFASRNDSDYDRAEIVRPNRWKDDGVSPT